MVDFDISNLKLDGLKGNKPQTSSSGFKIDEQAKLDAEIQSCLSNSSAKSQKPSSSSAKQHNDPFEEECKRLGIKIDNTRKNEIDKIISKQNAKYDKIEENKKSIKASNGMTYSEITRELEELTHRNWGGVVRDPKTGKLRFPKFSEIYKQLKYLASQEGPQKEYYQQLLAHVEELLSAKAELEAKHPEFKEKYTKIVDKDGNASYGSGIRIGDDYDVDE